MIGIGGVGLYFPSAVVNNYESMERFSVDAEFIEKKIGVKNYHVKSKGEETSDLCVKAFEDLNKQIGFNLDDIDCVVVCTQNPDSYGLPHTSAIVHKKLGLSKDCAVFDVSLGCSGYVYGLKIIKGFMQELGLTSGILFTADPYSKIINEHDKNTSMLFGDAAAATYVTTTPAWSIGDGVFGSNGLKSDAIKVCESSGQFSMNGRAVFNFAATTVPDNIRKTLELCGEELSDIDKFVLHQGSRYMIDTIADRLEVSKEKIPFFATEYGNTVSSSIPIALKSVLDSDASKVIISGFGVGLSWGSLLLTSLGKTNEY